MPNISGTMHLAIIKGIAKVPQDNNNAEIGLDPIDLLDPNGFSCDEYLIKIPALKSSALYADSPLTDGRTLMNGALGNVSEIIRLTLNSATIIQTAAMISKLGRIKQDCLNFWSSFGQVEPVYIKHQIDGEPGPRYALLYDIDIDIETPIDPSVPMRTITLSIEREYGWRGIAPGENPKKWTAYKFGQNFSVANADLIATTNHLFSSTLIYNSIEWASKSSIQKRNYIDIPATQINGDLPALAMIYFDVATATNCYNLFLSRTSKPTSVGLKDGGSAFQHYNLSAAEVPSAYLGTDTTLAADTGAIIYPPASASARRAVITFATDATNVSRLIWSTLNNSIASDPPVMDENMFRGRFAAFLRCRQVGGSAGDVHMSLQTGNVQNVNDPMFITTEVTPTIQAGAGNTADWPVTYMGQISIPIDTRVAMGADGRGIAANANNSANGFRIQLFARAASATPDLYVSDLMLVPIDECAGQIVITPGTTSNLILDNTGYFMRGLDDPFAARIHYDNATTFASTNKHIEFQGQPITLMPGVDNRIHTFVFDGTNLSLPSVTNVAAIYVDIVPRWSGLRDA